MREKLIKLIATCNNKDVRRNWIIEMSNMEEVECSESMCDSCIIRDECLEVLMQDLQASCTCIDDCKIDDNERCEDCNFVNFTPECIDCGVTLKDAEKACTGCRTLIEYNGGV